MSGKNMPLVSVVMPAYNGSRFIDEAIQSVLEQTYSNIELVIVDDGSSDDTVKRISNYKDKRIVLILNEENRGISNTTNRGILAAKGKYVALLDDDDICELDRVEKQVKFLESNKEIDVIGGRTTSIDEEGEVIGTWGVPRNNYKYIKAVLLFSNIDFANSSIMFKRSFFVENNLYYEEDCYGMQDYFFSIKSSKIGKISSVPNYVVKHRYHSKNESFVQIRENAEKRANKYNEIREYSLRESGFLLEPEDYSILNEALKEDDEKVESFDQWMAVGCVMEKILLQAREMQVEYYDELKIVVKRIMMRLLNSIDFLDDEGYISMLK